MALISERPNIKALFIQQWVRSAIIEYAEKSSRKNIRLILADLDDTG